MTREENREKEIVEASERTYSDNYDDEQLSRQIAFQVGADWADQHPRKGLVDIDKACEYLESVFKHLAGYYSGSEYVDAFRKSMLENE